jgi:hypothetical protein
MLWFSSQPLSFGIVLDVVEVKDIVECSLSFLVSSFECVEEFPPDVCHAPGSGPALRAADRIVTGIRIDYERALRATQYLSWRFATPAGSKTVDDLVASNENPHVALARLAGLPLHLHLVRGLIGQHYIGSSDLRCKQVHQGLQVGGVAMEELDHGGASHGNAETLKLLFHPVQWDGIKSPGDHQMRHEAGAVVATTFAELYWAFGDNNVLFARASEDLLVMHTAEEFRRHVLENHALPPLSDGDEVLCIFATLGTIRLCIPVDCVVDVLALEAGFLVLVVLAALALLVPVLLRLALAA